MLCNNPPCSLVLFIVSEKQRIYLCPFVHLWPPFRLESSLLEVLQMDFEVEELSSPLDSQVIVWKLELPSAPETVAKTEGAMRIYTTQRDFVGLAPLVMVSWMTTSTQQVVASEATLMFLTAELVTEPTHRPHHLSTDA